MEKAEKTSFYNECEKHMEPSIIHTLEQHLTDYFQKEITVVPNPTPFINEILQNQQSYISSSLMKIPMTYSTPFQLKELIIKVKCFVYYRLFYFMQYLAGNGYRGKYVFAVFMDTMKSFEINELFISLVLHESRGLIDDFEAGERSAEYLNKSRGIRIVAANSTDQRQKDYQEAVLFFRSTLKSPLASKALKEFLASVGFQDVSQVDVEKSLSIMSNIEFILIESAGFVGMNSVNNKVYFNIDHLQANNTNLNKSRGLANCYHEGGHFLLRMLKDDFGIITPRNKESLSLEAGFRLEEILFGSYDKMYWCLCDTMLNDDVWNNESKSIPLLDRKQLESLPERKISNFFRSGCEEFIFIGME